MPEQVSPESNFPSKRNWARPPQKIAGWVALSGSLACGVETALHFARAHESIEDIRTMPTDHPDLPPTEDILWHQTAVATERVVLAGEETAMRVYGVGSLVLLVLGAHTIRRETKP